MFEADRPFEYSGQCALARLYGDLVRAAAGTLSSTDYTVRFGTV